MALTHDDAVAKWKLDTPQGGMSDQDYNALAETQAQVLMDLSVATDAKTVTKSQIKNFYDACKNNTATIAQMRTAWQILLETFYKDYIS